MTLKIIALKATIVRFPSYHAERECKEDEIPILYYEDFHSTVATAKANGYSNGKFYTVIEYYEKSVLDVFSYMALHEDKSRAIFIGGCRSAKPNSLP